MKKIGIILILSFIFTSVFLISSCEKEETPTPPKPKTKAELLVGKTWYAVVPNTMPQTCFFKTDGTVTFTVPNASGTYAWDVNDSLKLTIATSTLTWWIKTLNDSVMETWPTFEPVGNIYKFSTKKP